MDLFIETLDKKSDRERIYELLKENKLTSAKYATNNDIWTFQYESNPFKKSWHSILLNKETNVIYGHIGLIPLGLKVGSEERISASISNGVIDSKVRNTLLPYQKSKTFAIIPLIDSCIQNAFTDGVYICFAHSTIHSLIWKTLKFEEISVVEKQTIHSSVRFLFGNYLHRIRKKFGSKFSKKIYNIIATTLVVFNILERCIRVVMNFKHFFAKGKITFKKVDKFQPNIDDFINDFYEKNQEIIACKRNAATFNWRFSNKIFLKYIFYKNEKIAGYLILEKIHENKFSSSPNYKVIDCLIDNQYLSYTSTIFSSLVRNEKLSFTFTHYVSCKYSSTLFKEISKQGYKLISTSFRYNRKKEISTSNMYYKINPNLINEKEKNHFKTKKWLITPLLFNPTFHY